uniref:Uncharacterized protein n=2 Tax=Timema TaxID=61471 RepID=A0A7R9IH43_9NEOP|nr:unnamed protein product [Timema bartmani]CAD7458192.1 unnamed protein product [Timema tahoe]
MIALKKVYCDELLQLALILSLLRVDPDSYLGYDVSDIGVNIHDLNVGTSWAYANSFAPHRTYVHPKNLDSILLNYEREMFEDLNALGRYNRINTRSPDVTAYLLNVDATTSTADGGSNVEVPSVNAESRQSEPTGAVILQDLPSSSRSGLSLLDQPVAAEKEHFLPGEELTQELANALVVLSSTAEDEKIEVRISVR